MKEVRKILRKSLGALGNGEETKEGGKGVIGGVQDKKPSLKT